MAILFIIIMTVPLGSAARFPQQSLQDSGTILADVIHQGISSINWTQDDQWKNRVCLTHFGQIFGALPLSAYERDIQSQVNKKNWVQALQGIRMAEIDGYTSPAIDEYTRQVFESHPMAGYLSANYGGEYLVYYRNELNGYAYAQRLNCALDSWSLENAYAQFCRAFSQASNFVWACDSSGLVTQDDRWYDGGAQDLGVFLKFYEDGIASAINYADQVWSKINSYPWPGYYPYHLGGAVVECEVCFDTIVGEYAKQKGYSIPYQDRVIQDICYKMLEKGWNSSLWSLGGFTVCHANQSPSSLSERRELSTLSAIQVLQTYYPLLNETMKQNFIELLTGQTPAWLGLVHTDLCDPSQSYRFRMDSLNDWNDTSLTDTGTAVGDMLLFLEGIVPSTGSLAIPALDEVYEDVCSSFSPQQFQFDYDARTIRIPVTKGELRFQFGSISVPYTFPVNGVYDVTFSSDWNSIVVVNGSGAVSVNGVKDKSPVAFEAWVDDEPHVAVGTEGCTFSPLIAGQHTVHAVCNATFLAQTVNVQTSLTTATLFDFDRATDFTYSPVPAVENLTTTFDASASRALSGDIVRYTWNFGDDIVASTQNPVMMHVYGAQGVYSVTLTVENAVGLVNGSSVSIEVLRHDVQIVDVTPYRTTVYEGYWANTSVTVANRGNFSETALVCIYCEGMTEKLVAEKTVFLSPGESRALMFSEVISGVPLYHNYVLKAVAAVGFDSDTANDLMVSSKGVQLRIPGDLDGNARVDIFDAILMSNSFNGKPGSPGWNVNADVNEDGAVDIRDAIILTRNVFSEVDLG